MEGESVNLLNLFLTFFLVFLNGFFVAAEFAVVKVRTSQLEAYKDNEFIKKAALSIINNTEAYLAATQLGITLASLGLGWVGEKTMTSIILAFFNFIHLDISHELAHKLAIPIGFSIITFLHIVFGELAPKSTAYRNPLKMALLTAVPLKIFRTVFMPIIWVLNKFATFLLRVVGIQVNEGDDAHSQEELKLIISESAESGAIEHSERELIHNVFDFDDRTVKQIFTHNSKVVGISVDSTIEDATQVVFEEGYSRYPVFDSSMDNIVGMVHAKDVLQNNIEKTSKKIREMMRDVLFINENKRVLDILRLFQKNKTEFGVVIDEFGATIGVMTMEDILEELVGDIQDEHDEDEAPIVEKINETTYKVYSLNPLEDINDLIPFPIPTDESYETLSGYIATLSEDLPKPGDVFENEQYSFKILTMSRKSPEEVELSVKNKVTSVVIE